MENGPARDVDGDGMGMLRVVGEGCSETQGCAKASRGNSLVGRAGTGLGSFRGKKKKERDFSEPLKGQKKVSGSGFKGLRLER